MSTPNLFIIESLRLKDEKKGFYEGKILRRILRFSGKRVIYYYIRTQKELENILMEFAESQYRYLHISCHGNKKAMYTTLKEISFKKLAEIMNPFLKKRRLFLSACSMTNIHLAKYMINISGCYSILGPKDEVPFDRAAISWASFYHLMLRDNAKYMSKERIIRNACAISRLFGIPLNYFSGSKTRKLIKLRRIGYSKKQ